MSYAYSGWEWLLVFYLYCFLGWCFESTVVSVQQRRLVDRGFLRGPMLPIYGFGATILLHVSLPLYDRPVALFFASMIAATAFEYVVGVLMERLFRVKYWDYSTHRFQFQGRICLQSSLCWGFLGLVLARAIHPPVEWVVAAVPPPVLPAVDLAVSVVFAWDTVVSVRTALDLARVLEELDKLHQQSMALRRELSETALMRLTDLSYRVDEARGEWAERMDEARGEWAERVDGARERLGDVREQMDQARDEMGERVGDARERILARLDELQQRFDERAQALASSRKRLLRSHPSARSARYDDVLQRLKKQIDPHKRG
ncbi:MAG: hypothetical protein Q4D31_04015 [Eubacteriales bacterium]|nr:hypothetical protein [Eubacteriales bacterium]